MKRKRITQIFPFLLPIRIWQRNLCYQINLYLDKNKYSSKKGSLLSYEVCKSKNVMINEESGYDIIYQKNKVDNLKIISQTMNHILIYPGETFSFCFLSKYANKYGKYKKGLVLVNDKIVPKTGGGVCQLSNLLYYLFLMSPLTIVERHGHQSKSFPNPDKDSLEGIDATIYSGWLDLKVRNATDVTFQIDIDFDDTYIIGRILSDEEVKEKGIILNENFKYVRKNEKIYEKVSVIKVLQDENNNEIERKKLYDEMVEITYLLPDNIKIEEEI